MALLKCPSSRRTLAPDSAEIWANITFLKQRSDLLAEAEACHRHALLMLPDNQKILQNLGFLLWKMRRFGEVELLCRLAVELASASSNLGVLFVGTKRETEAEYCCRNAIALTPSLVMPKSIRGGGGISPVAYIIVNQQEEVAASLESSATPHYSYLNLISLIEIFI